MTTSTLSTNDSAVLQALFDAESSPSNSITIASDLPPFPGNPGITPEIYSVLNKREQGIIASLQQPDVSCETVEAATQALTALIDEYPSYPPAYVNRAAAVRLLGELQGEADESTTATATSRLLGDLGRAITLCSPEMGAESVSPVQARVLADAHTHRGYLLLQEARKGGPAETEEMASRDFFLGGKYGNKIAQQLAVQTNPYAKMCGAIVKEALRKEVDAS